MTVSAAALDIYHSRIPMRGFEHAAARRDVAEAVLVRIGFSDGTEGWGETLPRPYVTGEDMDSVPRDLEQTLWPAIAGRECGEGSLPSPPAEEAAGSPARLPPIAGETPAPPIPAAGCAIDLAMSAPWLANAALRPRIAARVSGVLGSANPAKTLKRLTLFRLFGLRDFKLKLGLGEEVDRENLRLVHARLGKAVAAGKCTLRVDINGGWDAASTPGRIAALVPFGVRVVEQPAFCSAVELVELARQCELPLMADESLVTRDDARTLLSEPGIWWNIRLSKNGGLAACAGLAAMARKAGVKYVIGCMVGESGILSAAQRRLLQLVEPPVFVEGNYGRFLLRDDLISPSPRFGYGGRLKALRGPGLGVRVDVRKLLRYATLVKTLRA